ncbi:MAG: hypothetical protein FJZ97_09520 [Chloroflexi bacterium]|nr:hypothetical protein [Chloroflexota bacterium]
MTSEMILALQLAGVGMALVFGAILLLWAGMAALARITAPRPPSADRTEPDEDRLRAAAAAAALAVVRARQMHAFPLPPTALVSAWQAVRRSAQLRQRGPVR